MTDPLSIAVATNIQKANPSNLSRIMKLDNEKMSGFTANRLI